VSAERQSALPDAVRIAYQADGSATVNGLPVTIEPGQNVRDAAYQAAVGLVMAAGASGPVAATSVEADGARYPLTLYPLKAVLAANALVNAAAISAAGNAAAGGGAGDAGSMGAGAAGTGAAGGPGAADPTAVGGAGVDGAIGLGITGGFEGQYRRARRAWYRPTLSISWLVAGACACVLLSVLATVLLRQNDPSLVRLSVDTENEVGHSAAARAMGRAMASLPDAVSKPTAKASASKHPVAPSASPLAHPPAKGSAVGDDSGNDSGSSGSSGNSYEVGSTSVGVPQPTNTIPKPVPGPKPKPAPDSPAPAAVTDLTVALVGGDRTDPSLAYVITVSTSNTNPVTLTYTYAGSRGRGTVKHGIVLSGDSEYVLSDLIPAQPYCGGAVTMTVATSPAADNGTVVATTQPGC